MVNIPVEKIGQSGLQEESLVIVLDEIQTYQLPQSGLSMHGSNFFFLQHFSGETAPSKGYLDGHLASWLALLDGAARAIPASASPDRGHTLLTTFGPHEL